MKTARDLLWDKIGLDDLPGDLQEVGRALGMAAVRYLVESWGGLQLYVPSENALLRPFVHAAIRSEWDGKNEGELARRYRVARRDVVRALQEPPAPPDPAQQGLFEG